MIKGRGGKKERDENFPVSCSKLKKKVTRKQHSMMSRSKNMPHLTSGLQPIVDLSVGDNQVIFP